MRNILSFLKTLGQEFSKDKVPLLGAAQAYYYLLSLIPMLILILSILPYLNLDPNQAMVTISNVMPEELASVFEDQIVSILTEQRGGLLTIGILGTIWSASTGMNAFIQASNLAYNVKDKRPFLKVRLLSIGLTFGMIFALIIALVLPIFGDVIISYVHSIVNLPSETEMLFQVLRWTVSLIIIAGILTSLYHFAPNLKLPFKTAIPGALFATIAWLVTSYGFSIYVNNFGNFSETYGSLGGVVILMIWFFLIGIILVIGAEINAILYRRKTTNVTSKTA
ncbi:YihY/virulence factor BrkB family protein [Salipaludibacillus daqingensis]|uniref:YihY/virulence factor BrkB family protein n=1 Tax=Salipaludibacillus daqingensis TaxID=3041001 RepID=UPI00247499E4|nr:YihY/virulence factor BrkB family protein [Salipaludibacillus daqingensis]